MQHSKQLCDVSLAKSMHTTQLTIRIPGDLLWSGRSGGNGQLLGGAMQTLRSKQDHRRTDDDATKNRIPPIHPVEDLYPLYVLRALSCDETKNDSDTLRDVLSDTDFGLLSTERAVLDLQALGLPLHHQDETLATLFPTGDALLQTYVQEVTLKLNLTCMTLEHTL